MKWFILICRLPWVWYFVISGIEFSIGIHSMVCSLCGSKLWPCSRNPLLSNLWWPRNWLSRPEIVCASEEVRQSIEGAMNVKNFALHNGYSTRSCWAWHTEGHAPWKQMESCPHRPYPVSGSLCSASTQFSHFSRRGHSHSLLLSIPVRISVSGLSFTFVIIIW